MLQKNSLNIPKMVKLIQIKQSWFLEKEFWHVYREYNKETNIALIIHVAQIIIFVIMLGSYELKFPRSCNCFHNETEYTATTKSC